MSELVSIPQAARMMGVHRATVWRMVEDGRLKPAAIIENPIRSRTLLYKKDVERLAASEKAS